MAVAGLHHVSVLDSSFHRESMSSLSRQWGNHDRPSTRASSVLQMWRELEGEHVPSHSQQRVGDRQQCRIDGPNSVLVNPYLSETQGSDNGDISEYGNENADEFRTGPQCQMDSQNEHEDGSSSISEQFTDFGEVERGRVRQIFQEWMKSGMRDHESKVSSGNSYSRAQWLGENECERVRIIREWVRMTSQQRGTCPGNREEQPTENGAQMVRVCDEFSVNHCETGARRNIRRLCGRQALVDLLARAARERQGELQNLLEHRHVSDFPHRSRIQSLLRGRFLQSGRLVQDERPSSVAENELGLLRQRHTVSGLREGFISRLENFDHFPSSCSESDSSSSNDIINERSQTNSLQENLGVIRVHSEFSNGEGDINELHTVPMEGNIGQGINWQEAIAPEEHQVEFSENEDSEELHPFNCLPAGRIDCQRENVDRNLGGNILSACSQETLGNAVEERHQQGDHEVFHEQYEPCDEEHDMHTSLSHADAHESNTFEGMHWPHTSERVEQLNESVANNEDRDWQQEQNIELSGWRDDNAEGTRGNWNEGTVNHLYQEMFGNEGEEHNHVRELHEEWQDNDLHEAINNLLEGHSAWQTAPVGRSDTSYFPDDDTVYNSEIRELLSRRSVSNLLQSDFRESLDQLIQSYADRQAHASVNWELDGTSPSPRSPALVQQDVQQQSGGENEGQSGAFERAPFIPPSPPVAPTFWDMQLHDDNWLQNSLQQHVGSEWEIINDLRIDMAMLQQRINTMQRMLEACIDMQLELQRSVRQEISAALNRSAGLTDGDNSLQVDESKWDNVRKGLCCICCDNRIDSLLYRCGHMCTCSKCADKLVQGRGKCPMCRAPIVEMIRAYSIQ